MTIPYEEKAPSCEASVEAPEAISREEEGGRCSCRGQAGWFGDRVMLTTTLSVSEEYRPKCHALIVPPAHLGFWHQEEICRVSYGVSCGLSAAIQRH